MPEALLPSSKSEGRRGSHSLGSICCLLFLQLLPLSLNTEWVLTPSHAVPSVSLPVRIFLRHRFLLNVEPWLFLLFHPGCEVCLVLLLIKVYS